MNCDKCEIFQYCKGYKMAYSNSDGCCFGGLDDWCKKECWAANLCELKRDVPGMIVIEEEYL